MPNQMDAGSAETITIENLGIVIGGSMAASVSSSFVMNILLRASLNSLIQTIKILILIAHLPLLAVFIPANAYLFFSILQQILKFDIFDQILELINRYVDLPQDGG